ncbi:MAG TPA: peptidoglycan DD-metalloendopeptidase family protein [Cryomorphaceae bacterium]|nr:peptidoglycan DD-metalloendopeptidase family protein [Cryomorphaceae bacterium]
MSQDKEELQKERDRISEEISLTNKLIKETRDNRSKLEGELSLLNRKINLREDLIRSLLGEITLYNRQLKKNKAKIDELEGELTELKNAYAKSIRFAQRTNNSQDRLMFIFASEDFFQALRRVRYLQQYTRYRKKQADRIIETKEELYQLNKELLSLIEEKDRLISEEESTKNNLKSDLNEQKSVVSNLKQEERSLIEKLKKQERQREKLNKEIQRIIEAEIRASKKDNSGVYELTPEAAALSESFEKNRGKLPWPVERGVITSKFGPNPHPVLAGITIPNNGIDIATNENAPVRAVFEGTVSAVFSIAGAGQNVIVNHGGYRSVYSNLKDVFVSKGQKVDNKDAIGTVLTDESSGKTEAHIEIWKVDSTGTTKQDPALWIYRK